MAAVADDEDRFDAYAEARQKAAQAAEQQAQQLRDSTPANQRAWKEAQVERTGVGLVKGLGGVAYKFTSPARASVPDRLLVLPGRAAFFIEYKRWGEKPTDAQAREGRRLIRMGQYVYYIDCQPISDFVISEIAAGRWPDMKTYSTPKAAFVFEGA